MENIKIDDGRKSFTINGDPEKIISFNPTDTNLLVRYEQVKKTIEKAIKDMPEETDMKEEISEENLKKTSAILKKTDKLIKEQLNYLFDTDVSKVVFGNMNALSMANGEFLAVRFISAIEPIMKKEVLSAAKASEKRIAKHTAKYKKNV